MNEKKDREVRKLFNKANSNALDMLNNDELSDLTPQEIFIGSCKMALASTEELPSKYSPVAEVQKEHFAAMLIDNDALIISGDEAFEEAMQDLDVGTDVLDDN